MYNVFIIILNIEIFMLYLSHHYNKKGFYGVQKMTLKAFYNIYTHIINRNVIESH